MFNLRNRSFLKEIDFDAPELRHLLKLAEAVKIAKYAGTEAQRLLGKEIALIFEKTSTRTRAAFEVAAFDQGAHVTYLDPSGSQLGHKESVADTARVLGRMYDAIEFRGNRQADVEELAEHAGVPVYNGLTDEWHPTQMLADFLTMHEASGKPFDALVVRVRGRLPLQHGSLAAGDGRADGRGRAPRRARLALAPPDDVVAIGAGDRAAHRRADDDHRRRPRAVAGVDFVHTDVWVSMGEAKEVWDERVALLSPVPGQRRAAREVGQPAGQVHALPAGVPRPEHDGRPRDDGADRAWPRGSR